MVQIPAHNIEPQQNESNIVTSSLPTGTSPAWIPQMIRVLSNTAPPQRSTKFHSGAVETFKTSKTRGAIRIRKIVRNNGKG